MQGSRPQGNKEGGLAETGRQVTIRHYKEYTYSIPQLAQKSPEGRWAHGVAKDAGRQASERRGGRPGRDRKAG